MNPHASQSSSLLFLLQSLIQHRQLILQMIQREVMGRYKGSLLGVTWSFFYPILMLAVYTFVFSVVFKARWVDGTSSKTEFALVLFAGLMVFNLFSECITRAPSLIISNINYVKKVVFPLEIFPIVVLGAALFHFFISFFVWLIFYCIFLGVPHFTILLMPIALLPMILMILGLSWFLASLGVYFRDITQIIGVVVTVLMFLSPIFYPIAALPEIYRPFMQISPLTFVVEQVRDLMMWNKSLDVQALSMALLYSFIVAWLGFVWFQKTRKGFADVI